MNRVVFLNGFGVGEKSTEKVAKGLEKFWGSVEAKRFSSAMDNLEEVNKMVDGADVLTLSAGHHSLYRALEEYGGKPNSVIGIGAPLPTTVPRLLLKTVAKTARMHTPGMGISNIYDIEAAVKYDLSSTAELARHPIGNLRYLGAIARHNAIGVSISWQSAGIPSQLVYSTEDSYYKVSDNQMRNARSGRVDIVQVPGQHDELVLNPVTFINAYESAIG